MFFEGKSNYLSQFVDQTGLNSIAAANSGTGIDSVLATTGISATNIYRKFLRFLVDMDLHNASNFPVELEVYFLKPKVTLEGGAGNTATPVGTWWHVADAFDTATATTGFLPNMIDAQPSDAPGFSETNWKIYKRQKLQLSAGGKMEIKMKGDIKKEFCFADLEQGVGTQTHVTMPYTTCAVMLRYHGVPASDTTTPSQINYSAACLIGTWNYRIYHAEAEHSTILNKLITLNTMDPLDGSAQERIIDETGVGAVFTPV